MLDLSIALDADDVKADVTGPVDAMDILFRSLDDSSLLLFGGELLWTTKMITFSPLYFREYEQLIVNERDDIYLQPSDSIVSFQYLMAPLN